MCASLGECWKLLHVKLLLLPHSKCKLEWYICVYVDKLAMTIYNLFPMCGMNKPHSCLHSLWVETLEFCINRMSDYYYCSLTSKSICFGLRKVSGLFRWTANARCYHKAYSILLPQLFCLPNFSLLIFYLHPVVFFIATAFRLVFCVIGIWDIGDVYSNVMSIFVQDIYFREA